VKRSKAAHEEIAIAAGQPRYVLVANTLVNEMARGDYGVGDRLPTEFDLCKRFGISRHTVREAMRELRELGLVSRRAGVGTVVKSVTPMQRYVESASSLADIVQHAEGTRLRVQTKRQILAEGELCELLRCPPGQQWLLIEALRFAPRQDAPLAFVQIYIPPAYGEIGDRIGASQAAVYTLIESHFGERVTEVQQEIGAVSVSAAVGHSLQVKPRSPGLTVVRRYYNANDRLLEVAVNTHPAADRYRYSTRLRLRHEGAEAPRVRSAGAIHGDLPMSDERKRHVHA
jgi:GntR family transcriptional regulator